MVHFALVTDSVDLEDENHSRAVREGVHDQEAEIYNTLLGFYFLTSL